MVREKQHRDEAELNRIAVQFNHHKYASRYKIDIDIVYGALVGANKAEKEVSKHGFRKKI